MAGIAGIKIKIMPISPEVNLEELQNKIKSTVEENGGRNRDYEEQPIAFGLKAIIAFFEWPEDKGLDDLEEKLKEIPDVNSTQVIDMRKMA
ncbi:elongation factor 1-beta [Nanoarchaeota archaeon]